MSKFSVELFQKQMIWKIALKYSTNTNNNAHLQKLQKATNVNQVGLEQKFCLFQLNHSSFCRSFSQLPSRSFYTSAINRQQLCHNKCPEVKIPCPCLEDRTPPICECPRPLISKRDPCTTIPKPRKKCTIICPNTLAEWAKYKKCTRMCLTNCGPLKRKTIYCHIAPTQPVKEKLIPPLPAYSECRAHGKLTKFNCPECFYKRKNLGCKSASNISTHCKIELKVVPLKCYPRAKPQQKPWCSIERCQKIEHKKNCLIDDTLPPKCWKPLIPVLPLSNFTRPRIDKKAFLRPPCANFSTLSLPQLLFLRVQNIINIQLPMIRQFTSDYCLNKESKFPEAKMFNLASLEKYWRIVRESEMNGVSENSKLSTDGEKNLEQMDNKTQMKDVNRRKSKLSNILQTRKFSTVACFVNNYKYVSKSINLVQSKQYLNLILNPLNMRKYSTSGNPTECGLRAPYKVQCEGVIRPRSPCMTSLPFNTEKCISNAPCMPKCHQRLVRAMKKGNCETICVCPRQSETRNFCVVQPREVYYKKIECPYESFSEMKRVQFADRYVTECEVQMYTHRHNLMRSARFPKLTELNGKMYNLCQ